MITVYWIHTKDQTDLLTEGYVGITMKSAEERFQEHTSKGGPGSFDGDVSKLVCDVIAQHESRTYALFLEKSLRPKSFTGWNKAAGGGGTVWTEETRKAAGQTQSKTKQNPVWKASVGKRIAEMSSKILKGRHLSPETELTSERASVIQKRLVEEGKHSVINRAKRGDHWWQTEKHSKMISEMNTKRFKDTVTVTDKYGNTKRISKSDFEAQKKGPREDWMFVGCASKEGKKRREQQCL